MPSQSVAGEVTRTWSLTGFPPTKMARAEKWTSAVVDNLRCFIFCCVVSSGPPSSACLGGRGALHTHFIHPHCPSPVCKPKQSAALSWTLFILAIPTNEKVVKKGIYLYVYKNTHLPVCVCVCVYKKKNFFIWMGQTFLKCVHMEFVRAYLRDCMIYGRASKQFCVFYLCL